MASPIKSLDYKKFLSMLPDRQERFEAAPATLPPGSDQARVIARALHPVRQYLRVAAVTERGDDCKSFDLVPDPDRGTTALAPFGAGKYLTVFETIEGMRVTRAYSISSSPKEAVEGKYTLTIKLVEGGLVSRFILDNWTVGTSVEVSAPSGTFEYQPLRDAKKVICLAGGSGITPFLSMAKAIADGTEDFKLTILFGSRTEEQILFKEELEKLAENEKIEVVHVLSDEEKDGYENGFITAELIRKYAGDDYSVFICGPEAMYRFLEGELAKLGLERKNIRREALGVTKKVAALPDFPEAAKGKTFALKIRQGAAECEIPASAEEPILVAVERAGITAPSRCRSGECGWCRSKVVSGEYYAPAENESRRWADKELGYIHPCATFPVSDMEIEVPGEYV